MEDQWVIYSKTGKIMKGLLITLFLLITVSSCERDAISLRQMGQLHRTWVRIQKIQDGTDITPNKALTFRVEFRPNGRLLYGSQKSLGGCCNPSFFSIEGESMIFTIDASDPTLFCANSVYVSPELMAGVRWQITALTNKKLVLMSGKTTLVFEPVS